MRFIVKNDGPRRWLVIDTATGKVVSLRSDRARAISEAKTLEAKWTSR